MSSLGVVIHAHPIREPFVRDTLQRIDQKRVPVVWDREGAPTADRARRWRVASAAWSRAAEEGKDWSMVIQDDALICRDLIAGLEVALDQFPDGGLISPYTGTGRPDQKNVTRALDAARVTGTHWMSTRSLNWGVALAIPTEQVQPMLEWCSQPVSENRNIDYRIGLYFRDVVGWRTWYMVPSLVQHRRSNSLVGHDSGPVRRAHQFIGRDKSALSIDWSKTPEAEMSPLISRGHSSMPQRR